MKDLKSAPKSKQAAFFQSFDSVLCDLDGVLWIYQNLIPGASDTIAALHAQGKKIVFVSNKTTTSHEEIVKRLSLAGLNQAVVTPELAILSHLKRLEFSKEIFYLGMKPFREVLLNSGYKVAEEPPYEVEELIPEFTRMTLIDNKNIGAVITDVDFNLNYLKMRKASLYLKRPEVLFITANTSSRFFDSVPTIFNSGLFDSVLESFTGREALRLAKPSRDYGDFIKEKHGLGDPGRVLVIGDSVEEDMAFAANCGHQKLLVLSGVSSEETVRNWAFREEYKPEYYVDSLGTISDILGTTI